MVVGSFEFTLRPFVERQSERMGVRERHYEMNVSQRGTFGTHQHLSSALTNGLHRALLHLITAQHLPLDDRVYINVSSRLLNHAYNYRGLRVEEWMQGGARVDALLHQLSRVLNSNESFRVDETFQLSFTHVKAPLRGSGHKRKLKPGHCDPREFRQLKQSIIQIRNRDELCCARAIVTAKARLDNHPAWNYIRQGRRIQDIEAIKLHDEAHVAQGPCGYEELSLFAKAPSLQDYQLIVVDATRGYTARAYSPRKEQQIVLYYNEQHFDVITSLPGFFASSYVCAFCLKPYDHEGKHACKENKDRCSNCLQQSCVDFLTCRRTTTSATHSCQSCHRYFYGETCLAQHLGKTYDNKVATSPSLSVCATHRKCNICKKLLKGAKEQQEHQCGYSICISCQQYVESNTHKCYIQIVASPEEEKRKKKEEKRKNQPPRKRPRLEEDDEDDDEKPPLHIFFDVEAMQPDGVHIPNLVVVETEEDDTPHLFYGDTCMQDFLKWLDDLMKADTRPFIVLAHNFQGYDGYFIVNEYHKQNRILQQHRNGAKLLQVKYDDITFIDSLSFFPMPLSSFPKTFGLTELKKGFFPHLFNIPTNQDYEGPIPDKQFFMPDVMSVQKRKEFETWHAQEQASSRVYNFKKELKEYCISDVKLLKQGCLTFKKVFEAHAHFNPFSKITIAAACNRDLRQNRMEANTIANEPLKGWRLNTQQSRVALEWLHWKSTQLDTPLQHAGNTGEYRIPEHPKYTVDGYDATSRTVYEFQGCYWHGCRTCYTINRTEGHPRLDGRSFADVYHCTQDKLRFLRAHNYTVHEMWECQWKELKEQNEDVAAFVAGLHLSTPLNPREAFYGGRTNAIKMYHKATPGEVIEYYDYTSLYPWVNKYGKYPIKHPDIISQPGHTDISQYFGIAKCTVLPPYRLYHPVLPYRHAGKLTFPLCATCVEEEMEKNMVERTYQCSHSSSQRHLTGTWCTPELVKAVEMGYEIVSIHEVWHFPTPRVGLFQKYVDTWLKLKEQASGWPDNVGDDPIKRQQHIHDYKQKENIDLNPAEMEHNPGLRTLAKLMLNSMWGKFGQKENKTQVKEIDDPQELATFLESDTRDVTYVGLAPVGDSVEVHYKMVQEDHTPSPNLNIFVACFTTCYARLHLYDALYVLGERVLYMDTDSVIYTSRPQDPPLPHVGNYLGEFKNEISSNDNITEFVSGGPKNYSYKTFSGKTECKVRGITLNSHGSSFVNFDVIKANVLEDLTAPLESGAARHVDVPIPFKITRDSKNYELHTNTEQSKIYRLVFKKRVVDLETFKTYPYGYTNTL